jgi:hypothetical protein
MNYYVRCNPDANPPVTVYDKISKYAKPISDIPEGSHTLTIDTKYSLETDFLMRVNPSLPQMGVSSGAAQTLAIEADTAGILLNLVALVGSSGTPYQTDGGKPTIRNGARFTTLQTACVGVLALLAGGTLTLLAMRAKWF